MKINIIAAACDKTRVIGCGGRLPWGALRKDMARFRELTMGHVVIMGRKTWESLPAKPLGEGRCNVVVSGTMTTGDDGAVVAGSFNEALLMLSDTTNEVFVIGGQRLYEEALNATPYDREIFLTRVFDHDIAGDAFFPEIPDSFELEEVGDRIWEAAWKPVYQFERYNAPAETPRLMLTRMNVGLYEDLKMTPTSCYFSETCHQNVCVLERMLARVVKKTGRLVYFEGLRGRDLLLMVKTLHGTLPSEANVFDILRRLPGVTVTFDKFNIKLDFSAKSGFLM